MGAEENIDVTAEEQKGRGPRDAVVSHPRGRSRSHAQKMAWKKSRRRLGSRAEQVREVDSGGWWAAKGEERWRREERQKWRGSQDAGLERREAAGPGHWETGLM